MYTAEILEAALRLAEQAGYQVRHEWLGGSGGGGCQLKGRKLLFVDLALSPEEQLDRVLEALHRDPSLAAAARVRLSPRRALGLGETEPRGAEPRDTQPPGPGRNRLAG